MAVTTLTEDQVETAVDTSAPAAISTVEAPAKITMADFGLSSESIALAMNDYAKEFNAGGTPNLADIVLARGGKVTDLVELAVNNPKTSKAMMEGTQLDRDKALADTMQAQFFMEDDRGAGKASKLMNIVSKGISKKLESPAPAVDAPAPTATAEDKEVTALSKEEAIKIVSSLDWKINSSAKSFRTSINIDALDEEKQVELKAAMSVLGYKTVGQRYSGSLGGNSLFVEGEEAQDLISTIQKSGKTVSRIPGNIDPNIEPEAKTTSPTPPPFPEVDSAQAVDERAANEAFLKQQFSGSLGKYVPGERGAPFGKPKTTMGETTAPNGDSIYHKIHAKANGYRAERQALVDNFKPHHNKLVDELDKHSNRMKEITETLDNKGVFSLVFGKEARTLRKEYDALENLKEVNQAKLDLYNKQIDRLETKAQNREFVADKILLATGAVSKGKEKLAGIVDSFRQAGLAELNKDKHDAGHLLLGVDTPENVNAFKEANAKKTPENKPEVKPEAIAEAKPEAKTEAKPEAENSITIKVNANPVSPIFQEMAGTKPKEFSISERISHFISGPSPQTLGINVTVAEAKAHNAVVPPTATPKSNAAKPKGAELV